MIDDTHNYNHIFVQITKCICLNQWNIFVRINFRWEGIATPLIDDRHNYNHWQSCFSHLTHITRAFHGKNQIQTCDIVWHLFYQFSFIVPSCKLAPYPMQETWSQPLWLKEAIKCHPFTFYGKVSSIHFLWTHSGQTFPPHNIQAKFGKIFQCVANLWLLVTTVFLVKSAGVSW